MRKEEIEKQNAESQKAYDDLAEHQKSYEAMKQAYRKADDACVKIAHTLSPFLLAVSDQAAPLQAELRLARIERDNIPSTWHRKLAKLTGELGKTTASEILGFGDSMTARCRALSNKRDIQSIDRMFHVVQDKRNIRARSNFEAVAAVQSILMDGLKRVRAMHLRPLTEIRAEIARIDEQYEEMKDDLAMKDIGVTESAFRELHASTLRAEQDGQVVFYRDLTLPR